MELDFSSFFNYGTEARKMPLDDFKGKTLPRIPKQEEKTPTAENSGQDKAEKKKAADIAAHILQIRGGKRITPPPADEPVEEPTRGSKTREEERAAILKGIRKGAPLPDILLLACRSISRLTGDRDFYNTAQADIHAIYMAALAEQRTLEYQIAALELKTDLMTKALNEVEPEDYKRLVGAILDHTTELKRLKRKKWKERNEEQ
jgi:hypothetical protein